MGGTNETTVRKLRCHVNNGEVHIHDDGASAKFIKDADKFKREMNDALSSLKGSDGIIAIDGKGKPDLCVGNHDGKFFMFVHDSDCLPELNSFIQSI